MRFPDDIAPEDFVLAAAPEDAEEAAMVSRLFFAWIDVEPDAGALQAGEFRAEPLMSQTEDWREDLAEIFEDDFWAAPLLPERSLAAWFLRYRRRLSAAASCVALVPGRIQAFLRRDRELFLARVGRLGAYFRRSWRQTEADFTALARWIASRPQASAAAIRAIPWEEQLSVRKGFLVGVMLGFAVAGSTLWGISSLPYLMGRQAPEPVVPFVREMPIARQAIPNELSWFFIQYPYLSPAATVRQKNHHTFIVSDAPRGREYVVLLAQQTRRVEIYAAHAKSIQQVHIFSPGQKKIVWFEGPKVVGQSQIPDGNMWMWRAPLWNPVHLKIFALADTWMDSPYKRYSCAGFVHKFLMDAGVRVPILDAWDLAKQPWKRVTPDELEPGDIITIRAASRAHRRFWHHSITHVGVYIGHGKMIHASTASRHATRSWIRIADVDAFRGRVDKILRPPELL